MAAPRTGAVSIICGPTAAGKSALAMRLAERHMLAIVSADSRQVYRGFDIGTAKPSGDERARVPHYGIDVADPRERYSAARWADAAGGWLAALDASNAEAMIVGGTGFYLRALTRPLFDEPPLDAGRRARLAALLDTVPNEELRRWCEAIDPPRARLGRTQQLRAIEVALLTGTRLSDLHGAQEPQEEIAARYLVVDPGPVLAERINARVERMVRNGWVDEAQALDAAVPDDAPAWTASGYRTIRLVARGRLACATATERIATETRQYAKRQRTWFRHQLPAHAVTHVNPDSTDADAIVDRWWTERVAA